MGSYLAADPSLGSRENKKDERHQKRDHSSRHQNRRGGHQSQEIGERHDRRNILRTRLDSIELKIKHRACKAVPSHKQKADHRFELQKTIMGLALTSASTIELSVRAAMTKNATVVSSRPAITDIPDLTTSFSSLVQVSAAILTSPWLAAAQPGVAKLGAATRSINSTLLYTR